METTEPTEKKGADALSALLEELEIADENDENDDNSNIHGAAVEEQLDGGCFPHSPEHEDNDDGDDATEEEIYELHDDMIDDYFRQIDEEIQRQLDEQLDAQLQEAIDRQLEEEMDAYFSSRRQENPQDDLAETLDGGGEDAEALFLDWLAGGLPTSSQSRNRPPAAFVAPRPSPLDAAIQNVIEDYLRDHGNDLL